MLQLQPDRIARAITRGGPAGGPAGRVDRN